MKLIAKVSFDFFIFTFRPPKAAVNYITRGISLLRYARASGQNISFRAIAYIVDKDRQLHECVIGYVTSIARKPVSQVSFCFA